MTSSSHSDANHTAAFGRLYGDFSWCSNTQANTEYLQVDLGKIATLTGIATQGDKIEDEWVKTYTLKYSINGSTWTEYKEGGQAAQVSISNDHYTTSIVMHAHGLNSILQIGDLHNAVMYYNYQNALLIFFCSAISTNCSFNHQRD